MTIEHIIENEKGELADYLFGYCDDPLSTASDKIKEMFDGITDVQDIRFALEYAHVDTLNPGSPFGNFDDSIYLDVGEIEVMADQIEPDEIDKVTINGDCAYVYVGYGFFFTFDLEKLQSYINDLKES